ncbi:hypothetical protein Aperf_G00000074867 [Anoplocephala perfoliata]
MSTITMAPPGVFAASMPPELTNSTSPVHSSEDRESVSSTEGRRRRLIGVAKGAAAIIGSSSQTLSSSYCTSPKFVIESSKSSSNEPFGKIRKKTRGHRNRGGGSQNCSPYSVNKPLKVTIRRTNAHSHTLDSSMQDGASRLSPSSVYSSVPGDDEKSPILVISPHTISNSSSKAVDYSRGTRDIAVSTVDEATSTEPDQLGPCEPGTKINLSGSVWIETPGMLVVDMNWRGRSYVGALLDVSKTGVNLACPNKMITSISNLKNKINWSYASSTGNSGPSGTSAGPIRTRSSVGGGSEAAPTSRGRPQISLRGRRRRRGNPLLSSSSATALASDGMESNQDDQDEAQGSGNPLPQPEPDVPVSCPMPGCGKRFADMRCLYGHIDHIHRPPKKIRAEAKEPAPNISELRQAASPAAPQLAKAISNAEAEEGNICVENADEDPPPPKLDRGPTIDDAPGPSLSAVVNEQPPKASPAYSDISDGPTVESIPPWKPPPMVPAPALQQPPQQSQPQPLDWSIGGTRRPVPNPATHRPLVPMRSPYDFDPVVASEAAVQSRMAAQLAYHQLLHSSAGTSYGRQHAPSSHFNSSQDPLTSAELANLLFQRSQPDFSASGSLPQQMGQHQQLQQQQQQVRSPRQRQSPHNIPPGLGGRFRPPP